jgi:hypothetical protein
MSSVFAVNEQGQLSVGCFRNQPADVEFVSADFLSPDLSDLPGWRNATGFDLQAFGQVTPVAGEPKIRLIINTQDDRFFTEEDENGNPITHDLARGEYGVSKPNTAAAIRQIRIRIFVPTLLAPGQDGEDPGFFIDRICPRN